jgi:hypothetical protein
MVGGARIVRWAVIHGRHEIGSEVTYLAICRHDDEEAFYLFHCDHLWQVVADTWHETLEAAMSQAASDYDGLSAWQAV